MHHTPTLNDACHMLTSLDSIPRPYGDNEGDPINSDSVYYSLSAEHQAMVNHAEGVLKIYTRTPDQQPNRGQAGRVEPQAPEVSGVAAIPRRLFHSLSV